MLGHLLGVSGAWSGSTVLLRLPYKPTPSNNGCGRTTTSSIALGCLTPQEKNWEGGWVRFEGYWFWGGEQSVHPGIMHWAKLHMTGCTCK